MTFQRYDHMCLAFPRARKQLIDPWQRRSIVKAVRFLHFNTQAERQMESVFELKDNIPLIYHSKTLESYLLE